MSITTTTNPSQCIPSGECIPCDPTKPEHKEFCSPEGNLVQLLNCIVPSEDPSNQTSSIVQKFSLCKPQETKPATLPEDFAFFKFEAFNFLIALVSFGVIIWRKRKLRADQYRRLMRQIDG